MSAVEPHGTGVRVATRDGVTYWVGDIQDVTRALVLAATNGRLTGHGEVRPYVAGSGQVIVAVRLTVPPAPATVLPPGPVAIHQPRPWWAWPLVAGVVGLALVAAAVVAVVQLLAVVVPIVLGTAAVGLVVWVIRRAGGGRGGGAGGISITQVVNIRRR